MQAQIASRLSARVGASVTACAVQKAPLARAGNGDPDHGARAFEGGGAAPPPPRRGAGAVGGIPTRSMRLACADGCAGLKPDAKAVAEWRRDATRRRASCQPWRRTPPQAEQPSREWLERAATAPEGNLPIVERCGRKRQRPFPHRAHGWDVLRHRFGAGREGEGLGDWWIGRLEDLSGILKLTTSH